MYHYTRYGKVLIASMDDEHLKNVIMLLINKATQGYSYQTGDNQLSGIEAIAYDINNDDMKERAAEMVKDAIEKLPPYIFEATIRGIDFSEKLQLLMGRNTSLLSINKFQKLQALENVETDPSNI